MLACMPAYNIPKKKARLKVEKLSSASREYRQFHRAFYDSIFSIRTISKFYFVNDIYEIHSPELESRYNRQRKLWRGKGYTEELTSDTLCFLNIDEHSFPAISEILRSGLEAGNIAESVLCDPALGVQVSKHADVTSENILRDAERTILVLKFMKGKVKTVEEQMEHLSDMKREPQFGFDTYTSQLSAKDAESLFLSRMYYIFHFESEMDDTPVRVPPQICPVAFINFKHALTQKGAQLLQPKFHMEAFLKYLDTGLLPLLPNPSNKPVEHVPSALKTPTSDKHRKTKRYTRPPSTVDQMIAETDGQEDTPASVFTDSEQELFEPRADPRERPSFCKLDRESAKWRELAETFNADICRDADYMTITEMYYIQAPKLSEKYAGVKERWAMIGYTPRELADTHGYINVTNCSIKQLGEMCSDGIAIGNCPESVLSDPSQGVQLSQCPDLMSASREMAYERLVLMLRYIPGRQLEVDGMFDVKDLPAPVSSYNSIVSRHRHSAHASYLSKLTYLYTYGITTSPSIPPHICPVAFLRVKFRKGLKYKIPPVSIPNIEVLKKCVNSTTVRKLPKEDVPSIPSSNPAYPLKFKPADSQQPHIFSPKSLKRTISGSQANPAVKPKKAATSQTLALTSSDLDLLDPLPDKLLLHPTPEPKPWLSDFKSKLKRATSNLNSSTAEGATSKTTEKLTDVEKSSSDQPEDCSIKVSPAVSSSAVTPVTGEVTVSDSSSDDSLILRHVPSLCYGRRNRVISSDSFDESESDSPCRVRSRRTVKVIDSDDSESEPVQRKRRISKVRRTAASSHSVAYTSDSNTTICVCYDDAATLVQPTEASQLVSDLNVHPLILDCRVVLKGLNYPKRTRGGPDCTTSTTTSTSTTTTGVMWRPLKFEEELCCLCKSSSEEPGKVEASNGRRLLSSLASSSAGSDNTGETSDHTIEGESDDILNDLAKDATATKQFSEHRQSTEVESQSSTIAKDSVGASNDDSKHKKGPKKTQSSEPKKGVGSTLYEEIDIFASVRNKSTEKPVKRKRRKSASTPTSKEASVTHALTSTETSKKTVRFNLLLNTQHIYELDSDDKLTPKKSVQLDNVRKEALPMKQRSLHSQPDSTSLEDSISVSKMEGEKLKPVVDATKGYMRLPELPKFHEKYKKNSVSGSTRKHEVTGPNVPAALLYSPFSRKNEPCVTSASGDSSVKSSMDSSSLSTVPISRKLHMSMLVTLGSPSSANLKSNASDAIECKTSVSAYTTVTDENISTISISNSTATCNAETFVESSITSSITPNLGGCSSHAIYSQRPLSNSEVGTSSISGVLPPIEPGLKPTASKTIPPTIYSTASQKVAWVTPPTVPAITGVKPPSSSDTSLIYGINNKSTHHTSGPAIFVPSSVALSNIDSHLQTTFGNSISSKKSDLDASSAASPKRAQTTMTEVIPGISTPFSPDENGSDLDSPDVDEMLEASEASKKAAKSTKATKPFRFELTSELSKLVDKLNVITKSQNSQPDLSKMLSKGPISPPSIDGSKLYQTSCGGSAESNSASQKGATFSSVNTISPVTIASPSTASTSSDRLSSSKGTLATTIGETSLIDLAKGIDSASSKTNTMMVKNECISTLSILAPTKAFESLDSSPSPAATDTQMAPSSSKAILYEKTNIDLASSNEPNVTSSLKVGSQFWNSPKYETQESNGSIVKDRASVLTFTDLQKLKCLSTSLLPTCLVKTPKPFVAAPSTHVEPSTPDVTKIKSSTSNCLDTKRSLQKACTDDKSSSTEMSELSENTTVKTEKQSTAESPSEKIKELNRIAVEMHLPSQLFISKRSIAKVFKDDKNQSLKELCDFTPSTKELEQQGNSRKKGECQLDRMAVDMQLPSQVVSSNKSAANATEGSKNQNLKELSDFVFSPKIQVDKNTQREQEDNGIAVKVQMQSQLVASKQSITKIGGGNSDQNLKEPSDLVPSAKDLELQVDQIKQREHKDNCSAVKMHLPHQLATSNRSISKITEGNSDQNLKEPSDLVLSSKDLEMQVDKIKQREHKDNCTAVKMHLPHQSATSNRSISKITEGNSDQNLKEPSDLVPSAKNLVMEVDQIKQRKHKDNCTAVKMHLPHQSATPNRSISKITEGNSDPNLKEPSDLVPSAKNLVMEADQIKQRKHKDNCTAVKMHLPHQSATSNRSISKITEGNSDQNLKEPSDLVPSAKNLVMEIDQIKQREHKDNCATVKMQLPHQLATSNKSISKITEGNSDPNLKEPSDLVLSAKDLEVQVDQIKQREHKDNCTTVKMHLPHQSATSNRLISKITEGNSDPNLKKAFDISPSPEGVEMEAVNYKKQVHESNHTAVKMHLPSQLVTSKRSIANVAEGNSDPNLKESFEVAPSTQEVKVQVDKSKKRDHENTRSEVCGELKATPATTMSSVPDAFKDLFKLKGRKLPKSLLIDTAGPDVDKAGSIRVDSIVKENASQGSPLQSTRTTGSGIKMSTSSLELTQSKAEPMRKPIESVYRIAPKRPRYADPYLDDDEELQRVSCLQVPVFHRTRIASCAVSQFVMTCPNDYADTGTKSKAIFWETCPEMSSCTCISFTMAHELLAKGEEVSHRFNSQDEIDTVRLAIAYSETSLPATEHIVSLSATARLYQHIPRKLVQDVDDWLAELTCSKVVNAGDQDLKKATVKFTVSYDSSVLHTVGEVMDLHATSNSFCQTVFEELVDDATLPANFSSHSQSSVKECEKILNDSQLTCTEKLSGTAENSCSHHQSDVCIDHSGTTTSVADFLGDLKSYNHIITPQTSLDKRDGNLEMKNQSAVIQGVLDEEAANSEIENHSTIATKGRKPYNPEIQGILFESAKVIEPALFVTGELLSSELPNFPEKEEPIVNTQTSLATTQLIFVEESASCSLASQSPIFAKHSVHISESNVSATWLDIVPCHTTPEVQRWSCAKVEPIEHRLPSLTLAVRWNYMIDAEEPLPHPLKTGQLYSSSIEKAPISSDCNKTLSTSAFSGHAVEGTTVNCTKMKEQSMHSGQLILNMKQVTSSLNTQLPTMEQQCELEKVRCTSPINYISARSSVYTIEDFAAATILDLRPVELITKLLLPCLQNADVSMIMQNLDTATNSQIGIFFAPRKHSVIENEKQRQAEQQGSDFPTTPAINVKSIIKQIRSTRKQVCSKELRIKKESSKGIWNVNNTKSPSDSRRKILSYQHSFDSDKEDDYAMSTTHSDQVGSAAKRIKTSPHVESTKITTSVADTCAIEESVLHSLKSLRNSNTRSGILPTPTIEQQSHCPDVNPSIYSQSVKKQERTLLCTEKKDQRFLTLPAKSTIIDHLHGQDHVNLSVNDDTYPGYGTLHMAEEEPCYDKYNLNTLSQTQEISEPQLQANRLIDLAKKVESSDISFNDALTAFIMPTKEHNSKGMNITERLGRKIDVPVKDKRGLFDIPAALQACSQQSSMDPYWNTAPSSTSGSKERERGSLQTSFPRASQASEISDPRFHPYNRARLITNHTRTNPHSGERDESRFPSFNTSSSRSVPSKGKFRAQAWERLQRGMK